MTIIVFQNIFVYIYLFVQNNLQLIFYKKKEQSINI